VPHLIEIAFKGNRKEFFLWESDDPPRCSAAVIVDADRGEDLGRVLAVGSVAEARSAKVPHGLFGAPPTHVVKRLATEEELRRHEEIRASDDDARRKAMERVKANALVMKVTDAEWQWDRQKLTFYFTAEKRVDFRTLVRELATMFRTRIELKQIGVRDEAKRLDGIGRCGRQYCSASWLPELRPVNLGVAKDQRLSLNPSQISGACGRLMCCLRYEHEFYVQSRRKYPKELKTIRTSRGEEKVIANDIFRERITLRGIDGEMRTVPLAELRAEMTEAGDPLAASLEAASLEAASLEAASLEMAPRDASSARGSAEQTEVDDLVEIGSAITEEHPIVPTRPVRSPERGAHSLRSSAPPRTIEPTGTSSDAPTSDVVNPSDDALPAAESAADGEHRTQRRRGRRGGRRNRPSGGNPSSDGTSNGGSAPSGA
jgi:cell fate regulator YaaT (PSP1 superfamily)